MFEINLLFSKKKCYLVFELKYCIFICIGDVEFGWLSFINTQLQHDPFILSQRKVATVCTNVHHGSG